MSLVPLLRPGSQPGLAPYSHEKVLEDGQMNHGQWKPGLRAISSMSPLASPIAKPKIKGAKWGNKLCSFSGRISKVTWQRVWVQGGLRFMVDNAIYHRPTILLLIKANESSMKSLKNRFGDRQTWVHNLISPGPWATNITSLVLIFHMSNWKQQPSPHRNSVIIKIHNLGIVVSPSDFSKR